MGITFVVWMKALTLSDSTARIGNAIYITPFLSLVFIHFVAGEQLLPSSIIGLILIVTGITLQQWSHRTPSPVDGI